MCPSIILSKQGNTLISYCSHCKNIYIWHNNIMLSFQESQFNSFRKYTVHTYFEDSFYTFPDGEERLILHTPNPDICFSFTEDEWLSFSSALEEASYMQEIYQLIH